MSTTSVLARTDTLREKYERAVKESASRTEEASRPITRGSEKWLELERFAASRPWVKPSSTWMEEWAGEAYGQLLADSTIPWIASVPSWNREPRVGIDGDDRDGNPMVTFSGTEHGRPGKASAYVRQDHVAHLDEDRIEEGPLVIEVWINGNAAESTCDAATAPELAFALFAAADDLDRITGVSPDPEPDVPELVDGVLDTLRRFEFEIGDEPFSAYVDEHEDGVFRTGLYVPDDDCDHETARQIIVQNVAAINFAERLNSEVAR